MLEKSEDVHAVESGGVMVPPRPRPFTQGVLPVVIAIIVGTWFIGMGVIIAGYLIAEKMTPRSDGGVIAPAAATQPVKPVTLSLPADAPFLGNKDAKVTVVEYADYQCPFCGQFQKEIYPQLKTAYIDTGKVKYVFQDFPFLGQESVDAALAAQCAGAQGRFWEYHDALFAQQSGENEGAFSVAKLTSLAGAVGLQKTEFSACLKAQTFTDRLQQSLSAGQSYGVNSTPSIFINGHLVTGVRDWAVYQAYIDRELAR